MKQPSKQELAKLKAEVTQKIVWEEAGHFEVAKPTSIRLSPKLIQDLEKLSHLRGEKSYQALLKRWVTERVKYEMELITLAKTRRVI
jgi:predicted DNA-binding protein